MLKLSLHLFSSLKRFLSRACVILRKVLKNRCMCLIVVFVRLHFEKLVSEAGRD